MALNVIKVSRVSPATDSIAPLILPLTFFDLLWVNFKPTERVIFYKHTELSHDSFYSLILPKLEESLRLALAHFLPLSGHLKWDPQDPKPHIVIFPQYDTLSLTVAETTTDADFSRVSGKGLPRHRTELRPLVPELPVSSDSASILALQITLFPDQGFCIGFAVNHAAVDGQTVVNFLKSWAHICKYGGEIPQDFHLPMLLDRTVIDLPAELELKILELLRTPKLPPAKDIIEDVVQITLELSQENVKKLRERAKRESARSDLHLSTFVVSYAYVLTCMVKARGGDIDGPVSFTYVADFRDRLDPPVSLSYFGNCVVPISLSGHKAKTLLGENGFANGVNILSNSVRGLSSRGVESIWELYEEGLKTMELGVRRLVVAGSNKFGIYGSDFGWGRPVSTENITLSRGTVFTMSERRDETGGVEIGVCLKKYADFEDRDSSGQEQQRRRIEEKELSRLEEEEITSEGQYMNNVRDEIANMIWNEHLGWRSFCVANKKKPGDTFSFKLLQNEETPVIQLLSLNSEDVDKVEPSDECDTRQGLETTENEFLGVETNLSDTSQSIEAIRKRTRSKATIKEENITTSQNRFVTLTATPTSRLNLPLEFTKGNGINKAGKITMRDRFGIKWSTLLLMNKNERRTMSLGRNWKGFCEVNDVKMGESFVLELVWEDTVPVLKFCSKR
ncbi:hypothetical protein Bca101_081647 [Brassica carinata]